MSTIAVKKVKLGDNADLSKNFLIEVPAVADGTLTIKRENGANVLSIGANGKAVIPGVVGTVAQVGGVPTGQVVERGSNANGEYVRFADGTQICTGAVGAGSSFFTWTFPASFSTASGLVVSATTHQSGPATPIVVHSCQIGIPITTTVGVRKFYQTYPTPGSYLDATSENAMCIAIGRWF
jgi:hypothetical protein